MIPLESVCEAAATAPHHREVWSHIFLTAKPGPDGILFWMPGPSALAEVRAAIYQNSYNLGWEARTWLQHEHLTWYVIRRK